MRVSVKDLLRNFSRLSDLALRDPIVVTKNGRDRLVLMGFEAFERLDAPPPPPERPIPHPEAGR